MRSLFIFFSFSAFAITCSAQSDLLILKNHNHTYKTFFPGSEMMFSTADRFYDAYITSIKNDTVFLVQYDVRQAFTRLGVYVLDTVAQYHFGINYHNIRSFEKNRKSFDWNSSGAALFGTGVLLTTVGIVTWVVTKPNTEYYASPQLVIGAAAIAGVGYLLMKSGNKNMKLGKKYSIDYIKME
ncbi:MAG TPA: hypothetical protein VMU83_13305 [Hanamia sp.]|nr:hypothetical protein [Hanamia sp.]